MTFTFRYLQKNAYHVMWFIFFVLFFVVLSGAFIFLMSYLGVSNAELSVPSTWLGQGSLNFGISIGGLLAIFLFSIFFPKSLFLKKNEKSGKITIYGNYAMLEYGKKAARLAFEDMQSIKVQYTAPGRSAEATPSKCNYVITAKSGVYTLASSVLERKEGAKECSLKLAMDMLIDHSNVSVISNVDLPTSHIAKNESEDFFSGHIGDRMETSGFNFTIANVWSKFDGEDVPREKQEILIVIDVMMENTQNVNMIFDPGIFTLSWESDIPGDGFCTAKSSGFTPLAPGETRTMSLFYELKMNEQREYILSFIEENPKALLFAVEFTISPDNK